MRGVRQARVLNFYLAVLDQNSAACDHVNGKWIDDMFLFEDTGGETVCVIIRQNRDGGLKNDWPVVHFGTDKVHCAARKSHSGVKRPLMRV